jgi:hypothetical protein
MVLICLDNANEQSDQLLAFRIRKARENGLVCGPKLGAQALLQSLSLRRQKELACAPVRVADATLQQPHFLELSYQMTGIRTINAHRVGEPPLVNSGRINDPGKRRVLQLIHDIAGQALGDDGIADLLEPTCQHCCDSVCGGEAGLPGSGFHRPRAGRERGVLRLRHSPAMVINQNYYYIA